MNSDQHIARRLIAVRERLKKSQSEFADILNIAKNTLNGYEKGTRPLTLETARRIHERYNISVDWLLFGDVGQPRQELAEEFGPAPDIDADQKRAKVQGNRRRAS